MKQIHNNVSRGNFKRSKNINCPAIILHTCRIEIRFRVISKDSTGLDDTKFGINEK